jgi:hypothetical protein
MSAKTFVPNVWADPLLAELRASTKRMTDLVYGPSELRRKGHVETTPHTQAELKARTKAVKAWRKLTDDLIAAGHLEYNSCYECAGELIPVTDTERHEYIWDETSEEHAQRTAGKLPSGELPIVFVRTPINIGRD